jgi:hypothetical protein
MSGTERTLGSGRQTEPLDLATATFEPSGAAVDLGQQAQLLALLAWSIRAERPDDGGSATLIAFGDCAAQTATDLALLLDR